MEAQPSTSEPAQRPSRLARWMRAPGERVDRAAADFMKDHAPSIREAHRADPGRPFRILDFVLLEEFGDREGRTVDELARSAAAETHGLSTSVVMSWMESARKRGLIARRDETHDVFGEPLPLSEWELTEAGRGRAASIARAATVKRIASGFRVGVPLVAATIALAGVVQVDPPSWLTEAAFWVLGFVVLVAVLSLAPVDAVNEARVGIAVEALDEDGLLRADTADR